MTEIATWSRSAQATFDRLSRPLRYGCYLAGALFAAYLFITVMPMVGGFGTDSVAYWSAEPPLYDAPAGVQGSYLYSPAFWQVTTPLRALDWPVFAVVWAGINLAAAIWMGPMALAFPFTSLELYHGNIHLLLAAAIVAGFRYPAAWAFVLHTKASCGIGLLWFLVRREWRQFVIAVAVSGGIAFVSFLLLPDAWRDYIGFLTGAASAGSIGYGPPLPVRLVLAAVLVVWGALTNRRWVVPAAAFLALPNIWWHGFAVLAGSIALVTTHRSRPVQDA